MRIRRTALDALFSRYVRDRDRWTCTHCGRACPPGGVRLDCSHFYSRRHLGTRWDPLNADSHCFRCHQYLGGNPAEFAAWKRVRVGEHSMAILRMRALTATRFTAGELVVLRRALERQVAELRAGRRDESPYRVA